MLHKFRLRFADETYIGFIADNMARTDKENSYIYLTYDSAYNTREFLIKHNMTNNEYPDIVDDNDKKVG